MTIKFNLTKKYGFIFILLLLLIVGGIYYYQKSGNDKLGTTEDLVDFEEQQQEIKDLREYAEANGVEAAYAKVKQQYGSNQVAGHDYAHVIGRIAYEQKNVDGFAICDTEFGFGCYHGLLEALVRDKGPSGFDIARQGCNKLVASGQVASCLHGLGHGVMGSAGNIDKAIEQCKQFGDAERAYCYDGSYMEYYTGVMEDYSKGTAAIDENDPWKFCLDQYSEAQNQCVRNVTLAMAYQVMIGPDRTIAYCSSVSETLRSSCVGTMGLYNVQVNGPNTEAVSALCKKFTAKDQYQLCMESSAREYVFQNNIPLAEQLCARDATIKRTCDAAVAQIKLEYQR